jgi:hypothetical protein
VLVVGWLMAYYFHPWVIQRLVLKKELLVTYLVPFKKWCHTLYKEIMEFKERYTDEKVYDTLSKTLIIIDYRELHDVLREEGKYIGKIEEDNAEVANYLKELENLVDNLWHSLQDDFSVNFEQSEHDTWIEAIIQYHEKEKLVEAIKRRSERVLDHIKKEEFKKVVNYLLQQIPKW